MFQRAEGRIRVSFGFCLLTAWFGLVNGWRPLGNLLGAAAVHELGHCLALRCLGTAWKSLRIGVFGAVLETNDSRLSYGGELICVLAGPAANLLCAAVCAAVGRGRWDAAAGANLVLCIFNLLPLRPLDGGRALHLAVSCGTGGRGSHGPLGGRGDRRAAGNGCGVADGPVWRQPVAAPRGGGGLFPDSRRDIRKTGFFVKSACNPGGTVVSYSGYKGWSSAVHAPSCADVPWKNGMNT